MNASRLGHSSPYSCFTLLVQSAASLLWEDFVSSAAQEHPRPELATTSDGNFFFGPAVKPRPMSPERRSVEDLSEAKNRFEAAAAAALGLSAAGVALVLPPWAGRALVSAVAGPTLAIFVLGFFVPAVNKYVSKLFLLRVALNHLNISF